MLNGIFTAVFLLQERTPAMIQDIGSHKFILDYSPALTPAERDRILCFQNGRILLTGKGCYPTLEDFLPISESSVFQFLFSIDQISYFLAVTWTQGNLSPSPLSPGADCPSPSAGSLQASGLSWQPVGSLRNLRPMELAFAGYTGYHLFSWYENNRFCGRCGSPMAPGMTERSLICCHCASIVYPRINPCIIVAVYGDDRLLMTRYAGRSVTWFVLIAGFVEIGETAEDTVRREVLEETGVKVKNIRYFGSQPWGIPGNLTLGFTAQLDGSDKITLDTTELSDAQWFPREQVPVPDDDVSITSALIHAFVNHKF